MEAQTGKLEIYTACLMLGGLSLWVDFRPCPLVKKQ
jgi:hypothetical protein